MFLKNETPPLTCLDSFRALAGCSNSLLSPPAHIRSHIRCFSLAKDLGAGKFSPESCVLTGKDLCHSAWGQGSGKAAGGWHMARATTGLTSFEQRPGSFHQVNICALNSWKKITWLSTTAEFGFRPAKLIPPATSEVNISLGAPQRGERLRGNQTADNPEVSRCGDILFLCWETFDFIKGGS